MTDVIWRRSDHGFICDNFVKRGPFLYPMIFKVLNTHCDWKHASKTCNEEGDEDDADQ